LLTQRPDQTTCTQKILRSDSKLRGARNDEQSSVGTDADDLGGLDVREVVPRVSEIGNQVLPHDCLELY